MGSASQAPPTLPRGVLYLFQNISDHLPDLLPLLQIRAQGPNPRLFQVSLTSSQDWERSQKGL